MRDPTTNSMHEETLAVISRAIGGGRLAQRAVTGAIDEWYARPPDTADGWRAHAAQVQREFDGRDWRRTLAPALAAHGAAAERLGSADVVITTGQQPGLFGGPFYTLNKALTALALADALQRETGVRVAPVFWAATDDSDFAEASHVAVVADGQLQQLVAPRMPAPDGVSMSSMPLGDVGPQREVLERACGSAANSALLECARTAYASPATVGGAYVALMRQVLESLGIAVLDASHPTVRQAAAPLLRSALSEAPAVSAALADRAASIERAGMQPQVADVPGLSLVFSVGADGVRQRVAMDDASRSAALAGGAQLSPNVLLRPIVERSILPTVTYVGGPGEIAYFAQVSAVANALGVATPLIVPRWGGFVITPDVAAALDRLHLTIDELRDRHAAEGQIARGEISAGAREAMARLRAVLAREADEIASTVRHDEALRRSVGSMRAGAELRIARLERRLAAAAKRESAPRLRDVRLAQASLYPGGAPQERALSFVPYLARFGGALTSAITAAAGVHANEIVRGV